MIKLYVIIFGIMEFRFLRSGKINNIKILNYKKMKITMIVLWHLYKHIMKEKFLINSIIIILILLVVIGLQLWLQLITVLFHLSNGNINLIYKIMMVIQLQCLQLDAVNKYLLNSGNINQSYKVMMVGQQVCLQLDIVNRFHQVNGIMTQNFKLKMMIQLQYYQHIMV